MEQLGKIIPGVFQRHMLRSDAVTVHVVASLWPRIVGNHVAGHSRPVFFQKGRLILESDCASWASQLQQMSRELGTRINDFFKRDHVKEIQVNHVPEIHVNANAKSATSELQVKALGSSLSLPETSDLDDEMARLVRESFVKYFSRRNRMVD